MSYACVEITLMLMSNLILLLLLLLLLCVRCPASASELTKLILNSYFPTGETMCIPYYTMLEVYTTYTAPLNNNVFEHVVVAIYCLSQLGGDY